RFLPARWAALPAGKPFPAATAQQRRTGPAAAAPRGRKPSAAAATPSAALPPRKPARRTRQQPRQGKEAGPTPAFLNVSAYKKPPYQRAQKCAGGEPAVFVYLK